MDPNDIRKWAENHRAAAAREVAEMRNRPLSSEESFASAMALLNFDELMNGDPFARRDPVTEREDREMYEAWAKLRRRWPRGR